MVRPNFYRAFIVLLLSWNISLAQPRDSFADVCGVRVSNILKKLYQRPLRTGELVFPKFSSFDTPELLHALEEKGKVKLRLSAFESVLSLQKACSKELDFCFVVVKNNTRTFGKGSVILKGADGKWIEANASHGILDHSQSITVDFSKFKYLEDKSEDLDRVVTHIHEAFHRSGIEEKNAKELGDYLTTKQLMKSSNFESGATDAQLEFGNGIREANQILANKLLHHEKIDPETLAKLNSLANDGINPYGKVQNKEIAGVLRGTIKKDINMTKFEVVQSAPDGVTLNRFLPALEVPQAIEAWLDRVSLVSPKSNPMDVFALYKELVDIHPFADGNGRTSRMMLNYLLVKAELVPLDFPAHSLFFRPEDIFRKYTQRFGEDSNLYTGMRTKSGLNYYKMRSFSKENDMNALAKTIQDDFQLEHVKLEHLHGTSGYIFVGTHQGRFIQFESTQFGEDLSESLGVMVSRGMEAIDEQAMIAKLSGTKAPTYAIYPELLPQTKNYHLLYETDFLKRRFESAHHRVPTLEEQTEILKEAESEYQRILQEKGQAKSDHDFLKLMMHTPKAFVPAKDVEQVTEKILNITAPEYKNQIRKAMLEKADDAMKASFVKVYNAFNSPKFDEFMVEVTEDALKLCRQANVCGPNQRMAIPDSFLAQVLKNHADQIGIPVETISRYVGREPGRLYLQRIQRGALIIDDGAPGNHGMLPHALQSLFIYQELGKENGQSFFKGLSGWTYERMLDSNSAFTPIPSTRDITRRHYWTGILKAGNRSEVSKLGTLVGEAGHYPGFLKDNGLELVSVEEVLDQKLLNSGSVIRASYHGKEFSFQVDRDGVPTAEAQHLTDVFKNSVK
jgi:hypothetical protein